jgi:hypothetical protein
MSRPEFWLGLAGLFAGLAVALVLLLFLAPGGWVLVPLTRLAEWLNPGIDAPDNWAVGLTYAFRIVVALGAVAAGCLAMAGLRWWNSRRPV